MWARNFEAWVHKQVTSHSLSKDSAVGEQGCSLTHTHSRYPRQEAHEANGLISRADFCSYDAFKGPAATQCGDADEICHRHNEGCRWMHPERIKVEGQRL